MSIDFSQFIPTFLEESFEGLETMETSLLGLDAGDLETINTIFRAAHSIKGGAGTFGFGAVADFTHKVETLLDAMRDGRQKITAPMVNLLLESTDCIRVLLEAARDGEESDSLQIPKVQQRLEQALGGGSTESPAENTTAGTPSVDTSAESAGPNTADMRWEINFQPYPSLLQTGNEPLLMFEGLTELGVLAVDCNVGQLPSLTELNPEELQLSWLLSLDAACSEDEIREVFEWVEDECELGIAQRSASMAEAAADSTGWQIEFIPEPGLLCSGNDPLLIFGTLAELGEVTAVADSSALPSLSSFQPEELRLKWQLQLHSDCSEDDIREVFEWVEDECELIVKQLNSVSPVAEGNSERASAEATVSDAVENTSKTAKPVPAPAASPVAEKTATTSPATRKPAAAASARKAGGESGSIRVETGKIDALIDRVGELVITQSMLGQVGEELAVLENETVERLLAGLAQLERNTRDLQEDVMRVRMLPISFVFNRFPRMVHDTSNKLGKKVELVLSGEQTELDKTVMEKIGDPLVHLLRNSLDHGLETPEERVAAGKSETGHVYLNAFHQGGYIVIEISDDGRGLNTARIREKAVEKGLIEPTADLSDQEVNELIFQPGFSTAAEVSDLSGRGVGMDVVRRNIESLGGHVNLQSEPGLGSTFSVSLPLTLAILDGQLVQLAGSTYVVPLVSMVETILVSDGMLSPVAGAKRLLRFRDEYLPLIDLKELFNLAESGSVSMDNPLVVVVESAGQKVGLVVDELLGQQQTVVKSLETNFKRIEGLSGATILGDGSVALILDISGLISRGLDPNVQRTLKQRNEVAEEVA